MEDWHIDEKIEKAFTVPSSLYKDPNVFDLIKEEIFGKSWHYLADHSELNTPFAQHPITLLPGFLNEPLVLTVDREGQIHCLSNVCTHRGKILVEQSGVQSSITCGYHGRCFDIDGTFKRMPAFNGAVNFPSPKDDLPKVKYENWLGLLFGSLAPEVDFIDMVRPIMERVGWLPLDQLVFKESESLDFEVKANWALYCDNYLEGLHIPFVHPALNGAIEFGAYENICFPYCNLQIGIANEDEPYFELPENHVDYGKKVYGYYFWLFPNLMFNFYPWGLSLNIVEPTSVSTTKVRFRSYYFEGSKYDRSANSLEQTEIEDEHVVESVQLGVQSRLYSRGRFSPSMEKCVHHFHSLLAKRLKGNFS
jgi:choline monooxygenase